MTGQSGEKAASSAGDLASEGTRQSNSALAAFMEGSADTLRRGASQSYAKWVLWVSPPNTFVKQQRIDAYMGAVPSMCYRCTAGPADVLQSACCLLLAVCEASVRLLPEFGSHSTAHGRSSYAWHPV